ncbi:hypothetical protein RFI_23610 [Reticulomyxa filosa]|uniref:Peptidase M16 C-terminal domain-containing protein n=1 Tax=Reticulomyxa filosa TaxID=46433 RepID=X6MIP8_RETFI|nr:hypothetical protein RFI_23610 [Reticulomyxa filosa]|eukprot:ETO13759.1 hypothetical protein RFI_23610 [Reticulomyxa filosa]
MKQLHKEYLWRRGDVMKSAEHEIPEYMHQASYQGNTIGLPLFCDHNSIKKMTGELINEYIKVFYQPNRLVVVGTGVNHSEFERLAAQIFGDIRSDPQFGSFESEKARYTGGQMKFKYDFGAEDHDTHLALCFETENWHSPDLMALCVLNMLMGGGGSFSAGGPGKGMYTRLYRDVLGVHSWINHISCSHSIFDDTGIFGFYGHTDPEHAGDLTGLCMCVCVYTLELGLSINVNRITLKK